MWHGYIVRCFNAPPLDRLPLDLYVGVPKSGTRLTIACCSISTRPLDSVGFAVWVLSGMRYVAANDT